MPLYIFISEYNSTLHVRRSISTSYITVLILIVQLPNIKISTSEALERKINYSILLGFVSIRLMANITTKENGSKYPAFDIIPPVESAFYFLVLINHRS